VLQTALPSRLALRPYVIHVELTHHYPPRSRVHNSPSVSNQVVYNFATPPRLRARTLKPRPSHTSSGRCDNVFCHSLRQERDEGLLVCSSQGQKWYAKAFASTRLANTGSDCLIATSNDPWGPTGTDMADIAKITYNRYALVYSTVSIP